MTTTKDNSHVLYLATLKAERSPELGSAALFFKESNKDIMKNFLKHSSDILGHELTHTFVGAAPLAGRSAGYQVFMNNDDLSKLRNHVFDHMLYRIEPDLGTLFSVSESDKLRTRGEKVYNLTFSNDGPGYNFSQVVSIELGKLGITKVKDKLGHSNMTVPAYDFLKEEGRTTIGITMEALTIVNKGKGAALQV